MKLGLHHWRTLAVVYDTDVCISKSICGAIKEEIDRNDGWGSHQATSLLI